MTALPAPGPLRRGLGWWLHEIQCHFLEAVAARICRKWRNMERDLRGLPRLVEQDVWPSSHMTRFTIATTGPGLEYEFPHSRLLHFVGPSPPVAYPELHYDDYPALQLGAWLDEQQHLGKPVVFVAFGTMFAFNEASCRCMIACMHATVSVFVSVSVSRYDILCYAMPLFMSLPRHSVVCLWVRFTFVLYLLYIFSVLTSAAVAWSVPNDPMLPFACLASRAHTHTHTQASLQ
jgi:hypothetical protein